MIIWESLQSFQKCIISYFFLKLSIKWQTVLGFRKPGVLVGEAPGFEVLAIGCLKTDLEQCFVSCCLLFEQLSGPRNTLTRLITTALYVNLSEVDLDAKIIITLQVLFH